jgi:TRAP-type C4-dicarboxylate transport system substrate-binding protein
MNPAKYNSLPPDLRAILDKEAGVAGAMSFGKAWQDFEKFARETEVKKGLQINTLSPEDVAKMKELAKPIIAKALEDQEKAGHPAREFFAAYTK